VHRDCLDHWRAVKVRPAYRSVWCSGEMWFCDGSVEGYSCCFLRSLISEWMIGKYDSCMISTVCLLDVIVAI
jgi:hypothetical protein